MIYLKRFELLNEDTRYSRIPVYDENIDNIRGIVYIKDMLLTQKNKNTKLKNIAREAIYVLESIYVDDVFKELKANKKQIAVVVDEYGGTAGIVTMEDILEEIVGDIYDEYDEIHDRLGSRCTALRLVHEGPGLGRGAERRRRAYAGHPYHGRIGTLGR